MKVFITGVAGFMGSHLADRLIENGDYVVGVDNLVGGDIENVNPKVEFYNEDCDNLEKMVEYMKGCDVVFHAACTAHDGFSLFSPLSIPGSVTPLSGFWETAVPVNWKPAIRQWKPKA